MNKELSPLEALKNIEKEVEDFEGFDESTWYQMDRTRFQIIETALKDYEMEHTLRIRLENINYELVREKQKNDKELKAFEIIKKKKVNVRFLISCKTLKEYNDVISDHLTQEEYDLLKEVLL